MSKFRVRGIGLDTSTIDFDPGASLAEDGYTYVYTSIPAGNDYLIKTAIQSIPPSQPLITYTDHFGCIEDLLGNHLETLGRNQADLLLIDGSSPGWTDGTAEEVLHPLRDRDRLVKHFGIQSPLSVDQLKDLIETRGLNIEYVAMPVCPLEFNWDIVQWVQEKGLYLVGLNPMGGYLSGPRNIQAFTVPYLLSFSATYCDIVILSGRSLAKSWEGKLYLESLIGQDIPDDKFVLKRNISQPVKPLKKAVHTSIEFPEFGATVPYEDPTLTLTGDSIKLGMGLAKAKVPGPSPILPSDKLGGEFVEEVKHLLSVSTYPTDGGQPGVFVVAKNKLLHQLELTYPGEKGWSISSIARIGDTALIVTVTQADYQKGFFIWQRTIEGDEHTYLLCVPSGNPKEIIFTEVNEENSDEESANPNT